MKKIFFIACVSFIAIQLQAQTLYTSATASIYISGAANIDGNISTTPTLYVKGAVQNNGTLSNAGEMQQTGNFDNPGTFASSGDNVFLTAAVQNLSGTFTGTESFYNMMLNKSTNPVVLSSNVEVANQVNLVNGKISVGSSNLKLLTGATIIGYDANDYIITGGTGFLHQTVGASNVVFPVGGITYNPVTLNNTGTSDVFSVRVASSVICTGSNTLASTAKVNRMWYINEATAGGSNASITTQWSTADEQAGFGRDSSVLMPLVGTSFDLSATPRSAAASPSAGIWTQTLSGQTSFNPVVVTSLAALKVTGATTFCGTNGPTLQAPVDADLSYVWKESGAPVVPAATSASFIATTSGSFAANMTSTGGCVVSTVATVTTSNPNPTPSLIGLNPVYCKTSGLITLAASPSGGSFTVNGSPASSFDTDLLTVGASNTVNYSYTDGNGCSGAAPQSTFQVLGIPAAPVISSNAVSPQCLNSTVTITAPAADKYAWYVNGVFLQWATSPNNTLVVTAGTSTKNYTVYAYNAATNYCPSFLSNSISVIGSAPVAAITPSFAAPYCANNAPLLSGVPPTGSGYTYSWTCPTCSTTTNTPTMTPTAQFGDYYVTVTDGNGCSRTSANFPVTLNFVPVANAGADLAACLNTATPLGTNTALPGYSYSWTPATNLSATNVAKPDITATSVGTATTYTLRVTRTSTGCYAEDQLVATGSPLPDPATLTISSSAAVCAPANITLTPSVSNSVFWYKNGILMSSIPSTGAKVISSSAQPSDAYSIANYNGTCKSVQSAPVNVTINAAPVPTISSTPAVVVSGSSVVSICNQQTTGTAALVANVPSGSPTVSSYNWQQSILGVNTTLSPAVTSSNYTASVAASPASQNNKSFRVQANYANGCSANSVNVIVKLLPAGCVRLNGHYEDDITASFTAYPNPTTDKLTIALANYSVSEGALLLYNNLGQLVLKQGVSLTEGRAEESLDLSSLAVGMYNLVFQTKDGQSVQKIVKE